MLSKKLRISLVILAYLMVCYTLLRLGFFIANHDFYTNAKTGNVFMAFVHGLRFDLSAILMINGILLLLYNFPAGFADGKWLKITLLILFCALNLFFITINLSDYGYFAVTQKRQMSEFFVMFADIMKMLPTIFADYYYLFIAVAFGGALFVFLSWFIFDKLENKLTSKLVTDSNTVTIGYSDPHPAKAGRPPIFWRELVTFLLLAFLLWPGVKGGFQRKPIRQAHAFFTSDRAIGYLTLNSSFTVLKSMFQANVRQIKLMPEADARAEVKAMLCQRNEEMIDAEYPFLRRKTIGAESTKKNLVIFIMESWTADYIGAIRGPETRPNGSAGRTATPFFDSIAASGTLFTNFLANGHRSVTAIPSIIDSIAGFYTLSGTGKKNSFIESQSETNNYIGLGRILLKNGYTTSFHHGANIGALGLDVHSRLSGFLNYFGKQDYIKAAQSDLAQDTVWGVWDEEFFQDFIARMDGFKEPFSSGVFSLSSHEPFRIPSQKEHLFAQYTNDNKLQRALRYSDYSLQKFFETAQTKPWFKDTVFLITADHATHSERNNLRSSYHIPLLIYSPGFIEAKRCDVVGSHVDIMPTVLDLLKISAVHASMGSSLMDSKNNHYAVISDGARFVIFGDRFALVSDLEKDNELYQYFDDPFFKNDLSAKHPDIANKLRRSLFAYVQEVSGAIANNKICRDGDVK